MKTNRLLLILTLFLVNCGHNSSTKHFVLKEKRASQFTSESSILLPKAILENELNSKNGKALGPLEAIKGHCSYGNQSGKSKHFAFAQDLIRKNVAAKKDTPQFWLIAGNCAFLKDSLSEAYSYYKTSLDLIRSGKLNRENEILKAQALNNLGLIMWRNGVHNHAKIHFYQAAQLIKSNGPTIPLFNLLTLMLQEGNYYHAENLMIEMSKVHPSDLAQRNISSNFKKDFFYALIENVIYLSKNQFSQVVENLSSFKMELNNSPLATWQLAIAYKSVGKVANSLETIENYFKSSTTNRNDVIENHFKSLKQEIESTDKK